MWETYKETFDGVHASRRLNTEVLNMKNRESAKHRRRIPAAALAAVLAVVLAGTALAANSEAVAAWIGYLTVQVFSGGDDSGYAVTGSPMTQYPLSAFSPALLEASETRDGLAVVMLRFDTWDEVRAFVGVDIPCVWPDGGKGWTDPYLVYLFHTGTDQLWGVDIYSTQTAGFVLGTIQIEIRTENWPGGNAEAGLNDSGGEGTYTQLDSYRMANGATAELIQYAGTEDHPHAYCEGYFMKDGILYSVKTYGTTATLEETASRLRTILDAYE